MPIRLLQEAVELAPEDARFAHVYAITLNSAGRSRDAQLVRVAHNNAQAKMLLEALREP